MQKKPWTTNKRKLQFELYKKLLNYTCAHPDCNSGFNIEAHHIRPLKEGGNDAYWNIIALCQKCHKGRGLHSNTERVKTSLYLYKTLHELKLLGFSMDEYEPMFKENYKRALRESNRFKADELLVAENIEGLNL